MGLGWTIADPILLAQLQAWLSSLGAADYWYCDLYVNEYTPEPGDSYSDYDIATWEGYMSATLSLPEWGEVTVTDHVASSTYPTTFSYPIPVPSDPVTVYGYVVSDRYRNIVYAEGFLNPLDLTAGAVVLVQPVIRLGIFPPPDAFLRRRRTPQRMGVSVPADANEGD